MKHGTMNAKTAMDGVAAHADAGRAAAFRPCLPAGGGVKTA